MIQVSVIDYGAGNLASVVKALRAADGDAVVVTRPSDLGMCQARICHALVIPGVGHFDATRRLDAPWKAAVLDRLEAGVPLLGICLGMQWLYDGSEEAPDLEGLGVFAGTCRRIEGAGVKVPHVGWNTLDVPGSKDPGLLPEGHSARSPGHSSRSPGHSARSPGHSARSPGHSSRSPGSLDPGSYAYFTHSYAAPITEDTVATTTHGVTFASTVQRGRVWGAQWHPEKSGETGLRFLRDFLDLAAEGR